MARLPLISLLLLTVACGEPDKPQDTGSGPVDADGDGFDAEQDCDDDDDAVFPGAAELCNGVDDDCDGSVDEDDASDAPTWYADGDGDGFGDAADPTAACAQPTGFVADDGDCDDDDAAVFPGAVELCNGVDDDCDGSVDEDDASDAPTWYADGDGDGFGDAADPSAACAQPTGFVAADGDCDDDDDAVFPGAVELCNGVDDDCDESVDEDDASDAPTWYADGDGDGFGDDTFTAVACEAPTGFAATPDDCDDRDDAVYPGAPETCGDGVDDDCDGTDEACPEPVEISAADADAKIMGEAASDYAGGKVSMAGDVDGDGWADVLIAAMGNDHTGTRCGAAYLVSGPVSGDIDLGSATMRFYGEADYNYAGSDVAGVGDVNGDGFDDLLIGVYGDAEVASLAGASFLLLGPVSGEVGPASADAGLYGEAYHDESGLLVASAGDVNGDGFGDLLVGAERNDEQGADAGAAYLVLGPISGELGLGSADARFRGEDDGDMAGTSAACAGDVDGDGLDDVIIGSPHSYFSADRAGAAHLVLSPASGEFDLATADARFLGDSREDEAGETVAGPGDVNGDGFDDLLIGAPYDDDDDWDEGSAYLVLGPVTGDLTLDRADARMVGEDDYDHASSALAGAGDVDDDGSPDIAIGSYEHSVSGSYGGVTYVVRGPILGTLPLASADFVLTGESSGDWFGRDISGDLDVDGDGVDDLIVGAPYEDETGTQAGAAYLFSLMGL
jgi:hypothetical protein